MKSPVSCSLNKRVIDVQLFLFLLINRIYPVQLFPHFFFHVMQTFAVFNDDEAGLIQANRVMTGIISRVDELLLVVVDSSIQKFITLAICVIFPLYPLSWIRTKVAK